VINLTHVNAFNDWIYSWGQIELNDPTRTYSWSNNQSNPILAKLDRVLVSVDWDIKYPTSKVVMLPKGLSDHNPIKISFGVKNYIKDPIFYFEKWWLELEEFADVVARAWDIESQDNDPMSVWQSKVRNLRKKAKGWSRNRESELRKNKNILTSELDLLDLLSEYRSLDEGENDIRRELSRLLDMMLRIEEIKARQRSRDRDIKEEDRNMTYFFAKANHRKRKKNITSLEDNGRSIEDNEGTIKHVVEF
jgi:hypothetical protein